MKRQILGYCMILSIVTLCSACSSAKKSTVVKIDGNEVQTLDEYISDERDNGVDDTKEEKIDGTNDLYDDNGNLLWKGIPKEKLTKENKKRFKKLYEMYLLSQQTVEENTILMIAKDGKSNEQRLSDLCMEYNGLIPFAENGREYGFGYKKYIKGIDNHYFIEHCNTAFGLDGVGYLIWLFRNSYGIAPKNMEHPMELYHESEKIHNPEKLAVGDLCLTTIDETESFIIGVVSGMVEGIPVVSLCDNLCNEKFTYGSTRLCYIKNLKNTQLNNSPPVDFQYFFRTELTQ